MLPLRAAADAAACAHPSARRRRSQAGAPCGSQPRQSREQPHKRLRRCSAPHPRRARSGRGRSSLQSRRRRPRRGVQASAGAAEQTEAELAPGQTARLPSAWGLRRPHRGPAAGAAATTGRRRPKQAPQSRSRAFHDASRSSCSGSKRELLQHSLIAAPVPQVVRSKWIGAAWQQALCWLVPLCLSARLPLAASISSHGHCNAHVQRNGQAAQQVR